MMICGRKTITLPTPAMMPSTRRLRSGPSGSAPRTTSPSEATADSIQPIGVSAQLNTAWNTKNSSTASAIMPSTGCSSMRSACAASARRAGSR